AAGERNAMVKIKRRRTADCVVGGFRYATGAKIVGSLLLGLYDGAKILHHIGYTSSLSADERRKITPRLERMIRPPGFTGRAPGGPSRWSRRSAEWHPLKPEMVVEVEYDHWSGGRFRHGTRFLRYRPDQPPAKCTLDQVARARPTDGRRAGGRGSIRDLAKPARKGSSLGGRGPLRTAPPT